MSEIATYRCTNGLCRRTLYISKDLPIWKAGTPAKFRSLRAAKDDRLIERFRSETYCERCKMTVELTAHASCPRCGASDLPAEYTGVGCTDCKRGSFTLVHLTIH